ncbi:MAG: ferritin-like domain-containing protein [Hydrococcus sp. Prado102]|jgi:hypothetical protein|nr:ferritin-like domain-containing protein [Hydrococcus sp. Prado102]
MSDRTSTIDLAGSVYLQPNYFQIQKRINYLVDYYLSVDKLRDRLEDLPLQFNRPQPRLWQPIDWYSITSEQILGIDKQIFLSILIGTINTEAPIRNYTQTSRQYLTKIHPQMAHFVGGSVDENGTLLEPGLWEKEERQHTPVLIKTYQHLTKEKITPQLPSPKTYQPSDNPYEDLYLHGLHRTMTEYGATCLYLWLMAHTTGALQQVFAELVQDEINHMTKFWGFGAWLFPESYVTRICHSLCRFIVLQKSSQISHFQSTKKLVRTFGRMIKVLNWNAWSWSNKAEFTYSFICVMNRLLRWNSTLTPTYLQGLFEENLMVRSGIESPMNI